MENDITHDDKDSKNGAAPESRGRQTERADRSTVDAQAAKEVGFYGRGSVAQAKNPNREASRIDCEQQRSRANAISPLSEIFSAAYSDAVNKMIAAIAEFERLTGRVVIQACVYEIDVTTLISPKKETLRTASIDFLPTETEWPVASKKS